MHAGKLVFSQLMEFFPWRRFDTCVRRYKGDRKIKTFPCSEHLRVMAFAQLTYRESLRAVETCLRAVKSKWYHMGIRGSISRNNLSSANRQRDWRIYADFAQVLIGESRALYAEHDLSALGIDLDGTVYALDASTIDLCLSMFPWARFRKTKGAVKMHTLLNLQGNIPEFILISDGKLHDVNVLDYLVPAPGAYYVMDRGYLDFARLYQLWIAVSVYLLVAIVKKRLGIDLSLYTILQILSVSVFEKTLLVQLFSQDDYNYPQPSSPNQLLLFE